MSQSPPPPVINPKPKSLRSFGLPEAAVCVALVVVVVIGAVKSSDASFYAAAELVGRLIGSMVAAGVVAFIVWLVTRNRAPKAWVWTFAGAMIAIAVVAASFSKAASDAKTKTALAEMKREVAAARGSTPSKVDVDRVEKAAGEFAAAAGGKDRAMAQFTADYIKYMAQIGRSAQAAAAEFQATGGMDITDIKTVTDCEQRIAAANRFDLVARANLDTLNRLDAELDRLAGVHNIGYDELADFKRSLHGSMQFRNARRVRELDVVLLGEFKAYFTLLRDNFTSWQVENGTVTFSARGVMPKYNQIVTRIQELSAEQNRLVGEVSQPTP